MKTPEYVRGLQVAWAAMERPDDFMPSARIIAKALIEADALLQSQHEATWAMAMEAAAKHVEDGIDRPVGTPWFKDGKPSKHDKCIHGVWMYEDCEQCVPASIRAITCPPLQTTNEKTE